MSLTNDRINYALWTVSVEWRIYFVFPLLVLGWQRFGAIKTTLAAVATGYLLLVLLRPTFVSTYTNGVTPEYLGLFAMGMLGAGITFSRDATLGRLRRAGAVGVGGAGDDRLAAALSNVKPYPWESDPDLDARLLRRDLGDVPADRRRIQERILAAPRPVLEAARLPRNVRL